MNLVDHGGLSVCMNVFILFVVDHRITMDEIDIEFSSFFEKENTMLFNIVLCNIAR